MQEQLKKLPDSAGVYFFKHGKEILYIGRATSLKDRVRSYFGDDLIRTRGMLLVDMVGKADSIEFEKTDSVLEAIILEATLIKKHQPYYNTKEKDDKSFNYVVITDEEFPQVLLVRERELESNGLKTKNLPAGRQDLKLKTTFGPFTSGGLLRDALKIIRKIFPFFDNRCKVDAKRPGVGHSIGLCPAFGISAKEYAKTVRNIKYFFEGKKSALITLLEKEMKGYAKKQEFEKADDIKRQIFALEHINDIALMREERTNQKSVRIEAYDVAHTSGKEVVGVMTVVIGGEVSKNDYRKFKLSRDENNDVKALREILERRFTHEEWGLPDIVVVDGSTAQIRVAKDIVGKYFEAKGAPHVVAVTKDAGHRASGLQGDRALVKRYERDIVLANAEAHRFALRYHRQRRGKLSK